MNQVLRTGPPATGAYVDQNLNPTYLAALLEAGITHGAWTPVAPNGVIHGVCAVSVRG